MAPRTWDLSDPLEAAIWEVCDDLQAEGWNLTDDSDGGIPGPDEMFPSVLRARLRPLLGDWRRARIDALRAEIERLESKE